jgi:hypothetical protein
MVYYVKIVVIVRGSGALRAGLPRGPELLEGALTIRHVYWHKRKPGLFMALPGN